MFLKVILKLNVRFERNSYKIKSDLIILLQKKVKYSFHILNSLKKRIFGIKNIFEQDFNNQMDTSGSGSSSLNFSLYESILLIMKYLRKLEDAKKHIL